MKREQSADPHWDLVIEIAAKLWVHGEYVVEVDPLPTQRFVDLQWAARQAGRVLGGRSRLRVSGPGGRDDPKIVLAVTYTDPRTNGHRRAEQGLEALMNQVLAEHGCGREG